VKELFECRDCFHIGPLNVHGGCEECHSQAVISQELIALTAHPRFEQERAKSFPATA
jgi:hypothetical protein